MEFRKKIDGTHIWQTWWSLAGPKLPDGELRLRDNVLIAPIDENVFVGLKKSRIAERRVAPSQDTHVVRYPPRDEVQSRYRLQIDVQATNERDAIRLARKIADRVIVSLSLSINHGWYFAELRKYRRSDEVQESAPWSEPTTMIPLHEPVKTSESQIKKFSMLFDAIERNRVAENAYVHLLTAWQLQATAGTKPLDRSILQHYVLSIEAVVNGVAKEVRKQRSDKIRFEERKFAAEFAKTFLERSDKPEAIRHASSKLREISLLNTIPAIGVTSELLRIPEKTKKLAEELYRFRSRNLSHPGTSDKEDLQRWLRSGELITDLCDADATARAFFLAYCEDLGS